MPSPPPPLPPFDSFSSHLSDTTATDDTGLLTPNQPPTVRHAPAQLPKGAMSPASRDDYATPPATPGQPLLGPDADPPHAQFASYPADEKAWGNHGAAAGPEAEGKHWVPVPLRVWFWVPLVVLLVCGAITLEVVLHFTNKRNGWATHGDISNEQGVLHYVYTLPPVIVAMMIGAMWTWTDLEIKKMQPYVDLSHGDAPPNRSLLLDYTRTSNFVVWTQAAVNQHYAVALATLMVLLSLALPPLASALITVRDTWWTDPDMAVQTLAAVGLNQDEQFHDLTSFLTAAGFAGASVLYSLGDPPFVHGPYTVAPFQIPTGISTNGTVTGNVTAVKSDSGCQPVNVQMVNHTDGSGWTNSASFNGCSLTWEVDHNATSLFGTNVPTCTNAIPEQFAPAVFWFFTYQPAPASSATFCFPTISLVDVTASVDLGSGNLTSVAELRPFTAASNYSSLAGNVTGAPLEGRAYNGVAFNLSATADRFVLARQAAAQLQMPAAVFQAALQAPGGLPAAFTANNFVPLSTQVYTTYLKLIAKSVYFLPHQEPLTVHVNTWRKRVFLSDTAAHLLTAAMLLLALAGTLVHVLHRATRRLLRLPHVPGTIAAAVALGGGTGTGALLAGRARAQDMSAALADKKFRIDPATMRIVMEGEAGYAAAASPPPARRASVFARLQAQRRSWRESGVGVKDESSSA